MKGSLPLSIEQIVISATASDNGILFEEETLQAFEAIEKGFGYSRSDVIAFLDTLSRYPELPAENYKGMRKQFFGEEAEGVDDCLVRAGLVRWLMRFRLEPGYISPERLFGLGTDMLAQMRYLDAKQCADALLAVDPADERYNSLKEESSDKLSEELVRGAEVVIANRDGVTDRARYEQAIELYLDAVTLQSKNAYFYHRLSRLYDELHSMSTDLTLIEKAAVYANWALRLEPQSLEYRMNYDWVMGRLKADVGQPSSEVAKLLV